MPHTTHTDLIEIISTAWILWYRVTKDKPNHEYSTKAVFENMAGEKLQSSISDYSSIASFMANNSEIDKVVIQNLSEMI